MKLSMTFDVHFLFFCELQPLATILSCAIWQHSGCLKQTVRSMPM